MCVWHAVVMYDNEFLHLIVLLDMVCGVVEVLKSGHMTQDLRIARGGRLGGGLSHVLALWAMYC